MLTPHVKKKTRETNKIFIKINLKRIETDALYWKENKQKRYIKDKKEKHKLSTEWNIYRNR